MTLPKLVKAHDGTDPDMSRSAVSVTSNVDTSNDDDGNGDRMEGRFLQVGQPAVKHSLWE